MWATAQSPSVTQSPPCRTTRAQLALRLPISLDPNSVIASNLHLELIPDRDPLRTPPDRGLRSRLSSSARLVRPTSATATEQHGRVRRLRVVASDRSVRGVAPGASAETLSPAVPPEMLVERVP